MGNGIYSADTYIKRTATKIASGTNFAHSQQARATGNYVTHPTLDPKKKASNQSPFPGRVMRESRDNPQHPESTPITIAFDVTGSMSNNPYIIQAKLKDLFGTLTRRSYVTDPQIMSLAYGDAKTDYVPLQASEFESDNTIDENLDNLILEGHGGGNGGESSLLAAYFVANHTASDAWDKRGKKGYMFIVGDEISHEVTNQQVQKNIANDEPVADVTTQGIVDALTERYNVFVLLIDNSAAEYQRSQRFYSNLFGAKNVLMLEEADAVAETMALIIGMVEGNLDNPEEGAEDLTLNGSSANTVRTATKAIQKSGLTGAGGTLVTSSAALNLGTRGATRL